MSKKREFIIFGSPRIERPEMREVADTLKSGWLSTGKKVSRFEHDFGIYIGAKYAAALNSCTAALHLSILAAGIGKGDEVITTPMTFCATVNAIIHAGATPVLADIDTSTMNIDPAQIEKKVTKRTKAILPVHFAGRSCDMDAIMAIANNRKLHVIEDCAHSIETTFKKRHVGTFGDFGCFSFYVTKNIITGEGGMVVAKRHENIARIKMLGLHGMSKDAWKRFSDKGYKHYYVIEAGFKYNMMDMQAAIGIHQLKRIDDYWKRRKKIWEHYNEAFLSLPIGTPKEPEAGTKHAYHLYTISIDKDRCDISRDQFLDVMTRNRIGVGVHYLSLPEHPYYRSTFGWRPEDYPNAKKVGRQTVSLPISAKISDDDISYIISTVRKVLKRK